jgi:hypothetical protein
MARPDEPDPFGLPARCPRVPFAFPNLARSSPMRVSASILRGSGVFHWRDQHGPASETTLARAFTPAGELSLCPLLRGSWRPFLLRAGPTRSGPMGAFLPGRTIMGRPGKNAPTLAGPRRSGQGPRIATLRKFRRIAFSSAGAPRAMVNSSDCAIPPAPRNAFGMPLGIPWEGSC